VRLLRAKIQHSLANGRYWGGRLDPAEHVLEGLYREIFEESGLKIKNPELLTYGEWFPRPHGEYWHVVGLFFLCDFYGKNEDVVLSEEHDAYQWIDPKKYREHLIENAWHVFEKYLKNK